MGLVAGFEPANSQLEAERNYPFCHTSVFNWRKRLRLMCVVYTKNKRTVKVSLNSPLEVLRYVGMLSGYCVRVSF